MKRRIAPLVLFALIVTSFQPVFAAPDVAPIKNEYPSATAIAPTGCDAYLDSFIRFSQQNQVAKVTALQQFFNKYEGEQLVINDTYDTQTLAAVWRFQKKYASDILTPWGISMPTGFVYRTTLRKINFIVCNSEPEFRTKL